MTIEKYFYTIKKDFISQLQIIAVSFSNEYIFTVMNDSFLYFSDINRYVKRYG